VGIADAILEGEAHAVGMRGALGTGRLVAQRIKAKLGGSTDLAERVARSFGGAGDDKFTRDRIAGIHRRVARAVLSSEPRRGFDALVAALLPLVQAREEHALEQEIARVLNAADTDRVVHVLAVRILALQRG
jgi:hypothetical protein